YTYWQSTMTVLLPERDFSDLAAAQYALDELAPADGLILTRYEPEPQLVGLSVAEIARARELGEAETYLALIRDAYPDGGLSLGTAATREAVLGRSMAEEDIRTLAAWPHTNFCTDGSGGGGHPRGWGALPRVLRWLVRDQEALTLEQAVHRMTGLSAAHVGLTDRGLLREGLAADFVLFDPATIADQATIETPDAPAVGIAGVWVNGQLVYQNGVVAAARPGRFLRRPQ
ncbi:MAG: amidohydrolase family protein, partial [Pseudomonadota bacterium]